MTSWQLAQEYGFFDEDGSQPNIGAYFDKEIPERWQRMTAKLEEEFRLSGRDPAVFFTHDIDSMTLNGKLDASGTDGRWFVRPVLVGELWMTPSDTIARDFFVRYNKALD